MNKSSRSALALCAVLCLFPFVRASAVTLTNNTMIGIANTNFEGLDVVVSNCTLTVNGAHTFSNLLVTAGGIVTHSSDGSGQTRETVSVFDEPQTLMGTNYVTLGNSNILTTWLSFVVRDAGKTVVYALNADYTLAVDGNGLTQLARTTNSTIPDGTNVLVSYNYLSASVSSRLDLVVSGNLLVMPGGAISVNGCGYSATSALGRGASAGSPASGGGGGNAGLGGMASTNSAGGANINGSVQQPITPGGSGGTGAGGAGGMGGGVVIINCGGSFTLDGLISANGSDATNSRAGGGAGGSIWIVATNFAGAGSMVANGGAGEPVFGGGGGGGCIAIYCGTNDFTGAIAAAGGLGWQYGGAGTVFTKVSERPGLLLVDNAGHRGANTLVTLLDGSDVMIRGRGILTGPVSAGTVTVASDGAIRITPNFPTVSAQRDFIVQPGGIVHADGEGYPAGPTGGGFGTAFNDSSIRPCGGGGHAGSGGGGSRTNALGGASSMGNYNTPSTRGYAGGTMTPYSLGGAGGGYMRLVVDGTLQLDGTISANGLNGSGTGGGGGAGGSVYLTAKTLAGIGQICANGGNGVAVVGGGGGGGCVAVYTMTNSFAGQINALGGGGANRGGAGMVYFEPANGGRELIMDNGGLPGSTTTLPSAAGVTLRVRRGAIASASLSGLTFGGVIIETNSWIRRSSTSSLMVFGDMIVAAGGGLVADAAGYPQNYGPSYGRAYLYPPDYSCGGGGNGGSGGNGSPGGAGGSYDTTYYLLGSGGGGAGDYSVGGAGGGAIALNVAGTLRVDGVISANGANGSGVGGGGGAGGRIGITAQQGWTGSGTITANGGAGAGSKGGGGGGGRIEIAYGGGSPHPFTGVVTAFGGGGANWGGAGTIYQLWNSQPYGQLSADNAGHAGGKTWFNLYYSPEIAISGGASGVLGLSSVRSILVRSNSALAPSGVTLTVSSNVVIDAGGFFGVDGLGYSSSGTGGGSDSTKSGGSHGGSGGGNTRPFGGAYGMIQSPVTMGSGGGNGSGSSFSPFGGPGGGALKMIVNGVLQVDGRLSANGADGESNSGGGAGGSLWLLPNQLRGAGVISANGGAGKDIGGGGGGGRISMGWNSNSFTGSIVASGGVGSAAGGAGTVYLKPNNQSVSTLWVGNDGHYGTNTPLSSAFDLPTSNWNLRVENGAVVQPVTTLLGLSNIYVGSGGKLTSGLTNLYLATLGDLTIAPDGAVSAVGNGFSRTNGPGAGRSLNSKGAGGGYGGRGGASASGAPGGTNYGSATQPVERGSGGGTGLTSALAGSDGGGAIRISVAGRLTVDGLLSAGGAVGLQDDSGGGSGGSIWVTAGKLAGSGLVAGDGGDGDFFGGGGGGGGRIALYAAATNDFTGTVSAVGGNGGNAGENGTIFFSTNRLPFSIISQSPAGVTGKAVGSVSFTFNEVVDPATVSPGRFTLIMPTNYAGPLPVLTISAGDTTVTLNASPALNVPGDYTVVVNLGITDVFGTPLSQVYTGAFTVVVPTVEGHVRDINGIGISGVAVQTPGYLPVSTDATGNYALGVSSGWSGKITPSLGKNMFAPGAISLTNVTVQTTNQDFLMVDTIAPILVPSLSETNLLLNWTALPGVTYQAYWSTNLVDWSAFGSPLRGTDAVMQLQMPIGSNPLGFFRLNVSN